MEPTENMGSTEDTESTERKERKEEKEGRKESLLGSVTRLFRRRCFT